MRKSAVAAPRLPVIANGTAQPYPAKPEAIKAQLAGQLAEPVRFRESIDALYAHGCRVFLEVGAGSVLTGLAGKCLADRPHVAISLDAAAVTASARGGARSRELATLGLPLRFDQLHASFGDTLPTAAPPKGPAVVMVGGANLGKPYPPSAAASAARAAAPVAAAQPAAAAVSAPRPAASAPSGPAASMSVAAPSGPASSTVTTEPKVGPVAAARQPVAALPTAKDRKSMSDTSLPTVPVVMRSDDMRAQILEAQRLTQQALLESYSMTLRGLGGAAANVAPAALQMAAPQPVQTMVLAAPAPVAVPQQAPVPQRAVAQAPAHRRRSPRPGRRPSRRPRLRHPHRQPAPAPAPVAAAPAAAPAQASADTVLAIIAEKTGYPVEALAAEMDLEADLGIDSIKRVEILAAVNERVPGLDSSKVSPADVRRISDLLALLEGSPANPQQAAAR